MKLIIFDRRNRFMLSSFVNKNSYRFYKSIYCDNSDLEVEFSAALLNPNSDRRIASFDRTLRRSADLNWWEGEIEWTWSLGDWTLVSGQLAVAVTNDRVRSRPRILIRSRQFCATLSTK